MVAFQSRTEHENAEGLVCSKREMSTVRGYNPAAGLQANELTTH